MYHLSVQLPGLDTAIVVASNSGDAGDATREVTNALLAAAAPQAADSI